MAAPILTASSGNPYVNGILTENHWAEDRPGPSTRIAFNVVGDDDRTEPFRFGIEDVSALTNAAEEAAFKLALKLISDVCGLSFVEVATQGAADLLLGAGPAPGQPGALGFASTPGGEATGVKLNSDNLATDDLSSLRQGGYDFITVIHEIGHALGLNHPFDHDKFPAFPGVSGPGDFGDNSLNQGICSVMGYDDGFPQRDGPGNTGKIEGWTGTPMALDVAALQHLYGANTSHRTGYDTYTLPTDGSAGEFYSCIWDAAGIDRIVATGRANATIDLQAATLQNAPGGGGRLSACDGVKGGFTIAKGAVIENAQGGAGNDRITGNAAGNTLAGGVGDDVIRGLEGNDLLRGEAGRDVLEGGTGNDVLDGRAGTDRLTGGAGADRFVFTGLNGSTYTSTDRITGWDASDRIDLSALDRLIAGDPRLVDQADVTGASGEVWVEQGFGITQVFVAADSKPGIDLAVRLEGLHTLTADDLIL